MASWAGRLGWMVLAVLTVVVVIGINPWFALAIVPALLVASVSVWGKALPGEWVEHVAELDLGRLARRLGPVIGLAVALAGLS